MKVSCLFALVLVSSATGTDLCSSGTPKPAGAIANYDCKKDGKNIENIADGTACTQAGGTYTPNTCNFVNTFMGTAEFKAKLMPGSTATATEYYQVLFGPKCCDGWKYAKNLCPSGTLKPDVISNYDCKKDGKNIENIADQTACTVAGGTYTPVTCAGMNAHMGTAAFKAAKMGTASATDTYRVMFGSKCCDATVGGGGAVPDGGGAVPGGGGAVPGGGGAVPGGGGAVPATGLPNPVSTSKSDDETKIIVGVVVPVVVLAGVGFFCWYSKQNQPGTASKPVPRAHIEGAMQNGA